MSKNYQKIWMFLLNNIYFYSYLNIIGKCTTCRVMQDFTKQAILDSETIRDSFSFVNAGCKYFVKTCSNLVLLRGNVFLIAQFPYYCLLFPSSRTVVYEHHNYISLQH